MKKPTFTIIMPAYNTRNSIGMSLQSILNQSFYDFEVIVVDDNSQDDTWSIINLYANKDSRIRGIQHTENKGVAAARNTALAESKGRYIAFLDSDDLWLPEKLSEQYKYFCDGFDFVFSGYTRFYEDERPEKIVIPPHNATYATLLNGNYIGNLTGAYDKELIGIERQECVGHEDYLMWLRIVERSKKNIGIQKSLARYFVNDKGISSNKIRSAGWMWRIYRKELNMNFFCSCIKMFRYLTHSLIKRYI